MPLLRMHMYAQGVQLYCAPTADDRETWPATMRHIALEGRCFVLGCNQFALRSDYPADYPALQGDDSSAVMSRGGSCIVDPLGRLLAGPHYDGPTILAADLDLDEIPRAKFDFDVVGHYARPDVFRLVVNEAPTPAVVRDSEAVRGGSVSAESGADRPLGGGSAPRPNESRIAL
jgi:nitrilase